MTTQITSSYSEILSLIWINDRPGLAQSIKQYSSLADIHNNKKIDKSKDLEGTINDIPIHNAISNNDDIVKNNISKLASVQLIINEANEKLEEAELKKSEIEEMITKLESLDKTSESDYRSLKSLSENIESQDKNITNIITNLTNEIPNKIIEIMKKQIDERKQHTNKYIEKFTNQFKEKTSIELTKGEQQSISSSAMDASDIQEKRKLLEKYGINVPDDASNLTILFYAAAVAVLSRTMQHVSKDNKTIQAIEKLPAVTEEKSENKKLQESDAKQYEEINTILDQSSTNIVHSINDDDFKELEIISKNISSYGTTQQEIKGSSSKKEDTIDDLLDLINQT